MAAMCVCALVVCGAVVWRVRSRAESSPSAAESAPTQDSAVSSSPSLGSSLGSASDAATGEASPTTTADPSPYADALDTLTQQLSTMIAGYDGTWSIYVQTLADGEEASIGSASTYSASVIKLFVLQAVERQIEDGELEETDEVDSLLTQMITVSSNDATNELIELLGEGDAQSGLDIVNELDEQLGYSDTTMTELIGLSNGNPRKKQTSVTDAGRLLAAIYNGTCVNSDTSDRMVALLKAQTRTSKIPAGVPGGTVTANKTGEITGVENDAAIVWTGGSTDYVLVVFSSDVPDSDVAQERIAAISTAVWDALSTL